MVIITVTSQDEVQDLGGPVIVRLDGVGPWVTYDGISAYARDAEVTVLGGFLGASGSSTVKVWDGIVRAYNDTIVYAYGHSLVVAYDFAYVMAHGRSAVHLHDSASANCTELAHAWRH